MVFQQGLKTESGYLAVPSSGRGPGVVVLHAWWGLNDFFIGVCDRLAREGFVVLAPDLYHGAVATTIAQAEQLRDQMDMEKTATMILEALDALQRHPATEESKVGVMGFSLGAHWSLQLAAWRPQSVGAVVLFYGLGEADFSASRAAYLGHFAENDVWEPMDQVRLLEAGIQAAGREVAFYVYPGVGHWFFEENRDDAFDEASAHLAWERTVTFLRGHLQPT